MKVCVVKGRCPARLETRTKETKYAQGAERGDVHAWDPKDSELCLSWVTADESVLEALSYSDVQLDGRRWA